MTLRTSAEFDRAYKQAQRWHTDGFVLFYQKSDGARVGFTVSKKIGNAVKRNFAKRRLRALFMHFGSELRPGVYVLVAKQPLSEMGYEPLRQDFQNALKRLHALV